MSKRVIVCFGPGPKFKGGIANYNTSLALALDKFPENEVHIVSWTQQYPAIIPREFVDKSSKTDHLEGSRVQVKYITNYNNPFSWLETVHYIRSLNPEKVIIQWSIALQGLPLGCIARRLLKSSTTEVIFDMHFVVQKENSKIDRFFTRYGIKKASTYLVHALKTHDELKALFPNRTFELSLDGTRNKVGSDVIKLFHPIYDLYKPDSQFNIEKVKQDLNLKKHVFLFFGFIRKYKGLHNAILAFDQLRQERNDVSFLICGESFWQTLDNKKAGTKIKKLLFGIAKKLILSKNDDEQNYRPLELIEELGMQKECVVVNRFIPNEEVSKYFQVSDCVVLYYLTATPSGIESLSYNFSLPLLATKVGHFPETIKDGYNGYLAEANDIASMTEQMRKSISHPIDRKNVEEATKEMSWENYAKAILKR
jgi:glycosyltransferase involved in cell wall biosynthesis